mmetsp:Transcript_36503/g.117213  ORF Transcript_36503/g.117213 Transcript_36503/m.117213 type:complete len:233 (+) Transcript_36503:569-1267(+)
MRPASIETAAASGRADLPACIWASAMRAASIAAGGKDASDRSAAAPHGIGVGRTGAAARCSRRSSSFCVFISSRSLSIRIQRLRTDESERPGSAAAICRHLHPKRRTPSSMSASSPGLHMARPWSAPLMQVLILSTRGGGSILIWAGVEGPPEARSSAPAASCTRFWCSSSVRRCVCCKRCHRLRTASEVRPGSSMAMSGHCVPSLRTQERMVRSSCSLHTILRRRLLPTSS